MAKYENEVHYKITTSYDNSGIQKLNKALDDVQKRLTLDYNNKAQFRLYDAQTYAEDMKNIQNLRRIINNSINPKTGQFSISAFKKELNTGVITPLANVADTLHRTGAEGRAMLNSLTGEMTGLQKNLKRTSEWSNKIMTTLGNTVRWGIVATGFQSVLSSFQNSVNYVKQLDESLTQITMVSGESRDNMKDFAKYANKAAASLGSATTDYTNAVKVFIQEGFNLEESKKQAEQATILGNVSEQDTATTADQITAYRNAFNLSISDMDSSLDKLANIANKTAANVSELMTAAQKSASTAASVGASEDSFLASIATIQSVTRESAENIGNGLKSIYTRFADIKMNGTSSEDGETVSYGEYSRTLKSAGIDILDQKGNVKTMDEILSELQNVWTSLDQTTKLAVGEKVAGRYQYNRFATLMNNQEYYQKAYNATQNASGSMDQMQSDYMQGIEAQSQKAATNIEAIFTSLYNSGVVEDLVRGFSSITDVLSDTVEALDKAVPGFGALGTFISILATVALKFGSASIGENLANAQFNEEARVANDIDRKEKQETTLAELYADGLITEKNEKGETVFSPEITQLARNNMRIQSYSENLTGDLQDEIVENQHNVIDALNNETFAAQDLEEHLLKIAEAEERISGNSNLRVALDTRKDALNDEREAAKKLWEIEDEIEEARRHGRNLANSEYKYDGESISLLEARDKASEEYKKARTSVRQGNNSLQGIYDTYVPQSMQNIRTDSQPSRNALHGNQMAKLIDKAKMTWDNEAADEYNGVNNNLTEKGQFQGIIDYINNNQTKILNTNDARVAFGQLKYVNGGVSGNEKVLNDTNEALEVLKQKIIAVAEAEVDAARQAKDASTKAEKAQEEMSKAVLNTNDALGKQEGLQKHAANASDYANVSKWMSGLTSAASGLAFTLSSLASTWDTLNDANASSVEKLQALLSSVVMLVSGVGMLINGWKELSKAINLQSIATVIDTAATILNTKANKENTEVKSQNCQETQNDTVANMEHAASEVLDETIPDGNGTISQNSKTGKKSKKKKTPHGGSAKTYKRNTKKSGSFGGKTISKNKGGTGLPVNNAPQVLESTTKSGSLLDKGKAVVEKIINSEQFGATKNIVRSLGSLGKALAPMAPLIAGVAAEVAILAIAWNLTESNINASKVALQEAQEKLTDWNTAVESANSALETFNSTLSEMEEHQDAFAGLAEGSFEFTDAIRQANQDASDFYHTYKDILNSYDGDVFTTGIHGESLITDEAKKHVKEQLYINKASAYAGQADAQYAVDKAQTKVDAEKIAADVEWKKDFGQSAEEMFGTLLGGLGGAASGALAGAIAGSAVPVLGTIIGAVGGGLIGATLGNINANTDIDRSDADKITEIAQVIHDNNISLAQDEESLKSSLAAAGVDLNDYSNEFITNLKNCSGDIQALGAAAAAAADALWSAKKSAGQQILQDNANYNNSNATVKQMAEQTVGEKALAGGEYYEQAKEEYSDTIIVDDGDGISTTITAYKTATDKQKSTYASAHGIYYENGTYYKDSTKAEKVEDKDIPTNEEVMEEATYQRAIELGEADTKNQNNIISTAQRANDKIRAALGYDDTVVRQFINSKGSISDEVIQNIDLSKLEGLTHDELVAAGILTEDEAANADFNGSSYAERIQKQLSKNNFYTKGVSDKTGGTIYTLNEDQVETYRDKTISSQLSSNSSVSNETVYSSNFIGDDGSSIGINQRENIEKQIQETLDNLTTENQKYVLDNNLLDLDESTPEEILSQLEKFSSDKNVEAYKHDTLSETEISNMASAWEGDTSAVKALAEQYVNLADESEDINDTLSTNKDLATVLANNNLRVSSGVEDLATVFEEYGDALKSGNKTSKQYIVGLQGIESAMKKVLGEDFDFDSLDDDFFQSAENLSLMEEAANGSNEALEQLYDNAALNVLKNAGEEASSTILELQNLINNINLDDIKVGVDLEDTDFYDAMMDLITTSGMTADQINAIFKGIQFDADVSTETIPVNSINRDSATGSYTYTMDTPYGEQTYTLTSDQVASVETLGYVELPVLNGKATYTQAAAQAHVDTKSSGGGRSKKPKVYEYDRYEKVNNKLDRNIARYDKLAQAQEDLSGLDLTKNILQQNKLLEQQIDLQKQKAEIQQDEAIELREELEGVGVIFDEDGIINNWKDIIDKINAEGAALVNSDEDAYDEWQEDADQIIEWYDRWNELDDEIIETETEQEELTDQIQDNIYQCYQNAIDYADTLQEVKKNLQDINDLIAEIAGKDTLTFKATNAKESIEDFYNAQSEAKKTLQNTYETLAGKDAIEGYAGFANVMKSTITDEDTYYTMLLKEKQLAKQMYNEMLDLEEGETISYGGQEYSRDKAQAFLEGVYQPTIDALNDLLSDLEDSFGDLQDVIDTQSEKYYESFEKLNESVERVNDSLEYMATMEELLYGNRSSELKNIYQQQYDLQVQNLESLQKQKESYAETETYWAEVRDSYEEGSTQWEYYNDKYEEAFDARLEAEENIQSALEEMANLAYSVADAQADEAVDSLMSQIFGTNELGSLDYYYQKQWELLQNQAEEYYDEVNRAYQVSTLKNKYLDLIDKSDLSAQKQITEQMEEQLAILNEKDELSKYDIEYANAQLNILEKQIALQDAQNNKSKMKLKRDSQGNYTYQYVSDEDAIRSAQQELEDATNELYNLVKNRYIELQDLTMTLQENLRDQLKDIISDTQLTSEEKTKLMEQVINQYAEDMTRISGEASTLTSDLANAANLSIGSIGEYTADTILDIDDRLSQFMDGDGEWAKKIESFAYNVDNLSTSLKEDILSDIDELDKRLQEIFEGVEGNSGLNDRLEYLNKQLDEISATTSGITDDMRSIVDYDTSIRTSFSGATDTANNTEFSQDTPEPEAETETDVSTPITQEVDKTIDDVSVGDKATYIGTGYAVYRSSDGTKAEGTGETNSTVIIKNISRASWSTHPFNVANVNGGKPQGWVDTSSLDLGKKTVSLDTGGYTGDWNENTQYYKNGKLAILHQKELVLNAEQTEHILEAAKLVSSMTAALQNISFDNLFSSVASLGEKTQSGIEQNITINADFPAANSAAEIKLALEGLANQASVYAYRNK